MADSSLRDPNRNELRRQVFTAILESLKQLPSFKHAAFVSAVLSNLIDSDRQPLDVLIDAIDRARLQVLP